MMMSETINELAAALAKAQIEMKNAPLNASNPHFKNRYADLASVRDACVPVLAKHGIATSQMIVGDRLVTAIMHSSGQWIASEYPLPPTDKAQAFGSSLTYAKRYSLAAIVGIAADEDDDANTADHAPPKPKATPAPRPAKTANGNGGSSDVKALAQQLASEIATLKDDEAMTQWWKDTAERRAQLPNSWQERLAQLFDERLEQLPKPEPDLPHEARVLQAG